ncbi:hypothetical protein RHMOL_Rhmol04G0243300 [Rhododendron molle]|uniref:Uncharacterized protein n=1 Tax=Rhododendron molle TaxID=49168 RepID=A0ACC0P530_RHOML|nr:hypothetical protein RHMOL_Rhmol04G0243300 [Rhododendron molle]
MQPMLSSNSLGAHTQTSLVFTRLVFAFSQLLSSVFYEWIVEKATPATSMFLLLQLPCWLLLMRGNSPQNPIV